MQLEILKFWRDVEIFNIPSPPKREKGKNLKVAKYLPGAPLPWQPGHVGTLAPTQDKDWTHAIFLGVAACREWAKVVLQATCQEQELSEGDLQQIGGEGWVAAFVVNGQGQIVSDSYVPASFALGVQRLSSKKTLDALNDDIQEQVKKFKERHIGASSSPDGAEQEEPKAPSAVAQESDEKTLSVPIGWAELDAEWRHVLGLFGSQEPALGFSVVIKSTLRKRRRNDVPDKTDTDIDFLNSFYLNDLDCLIREADSKRFLGKALAQYLGPASSGQDRQDILARSQAMATCISPGKITLGRWPASSKHHLMLAQQAAVGEIVAQLQDSSAGLVAVNGPPGTGKTTLLCDVVADVVVRRAQALAKLEAPLQAFGKKTTVGGLGVFPLKPEIVGGTGIVVTSNNNTAVENITRELPALAKIAREEHGNAAYFQEVAAHVFEAAEIKAPAWGLVAAALGNSDNRRKFANAFFREGQQSFVSGQACDIKTVLEAPPDNAIDQWQAVKCEFLALLEKVEETRRRFAEVSDALTQLVALRGRVAENHQQAEATNAELKALYGKGVAQVEDIKFVLMSSQARLADAAEAEQQAKLAVQIANDRVQAAEIGCSPRLWDRCLKALGVTTRRMNIWENATRELLVNRADAADVWRKASEVLGRCKQARTHNENELISLKISLKREQTNLQTRLNVIEQQLKHDQQLCQRYEAQIVALKKTGAAVPDEMFFNLAMKERHLASVWVDPEFDLLRARLFLAALSLHETTMLACHGKAIANLRAVKGMLTRDTPEPIAEDQRGCLWDMLFFTVPVVSSTLASFSRLFVGLGRESLGWLLIDEAGQATPQSVAGALWRGRRAVVIGDPLQIEPVMTVPSAVVVELRRRRGIDVEWSPAKESAQTIADRTMNLGAWIGRGASMSETAVWTGLPLRAHRRCIEPMFSVANTIAYDNQMVQANTNPAMISCLLGESSWFDVRGLSSDDQVVAEEMICLERLLRQLKDDWPITENGNRSSMFVISPFRKVADECKNMFGKVNLSSKEWPVDSGTVHRFQGKEADIVLIVLGSAPGTAGSGSRNWASGKPNLINVALTRAKLRVYVIGNMIDWQSCPSFDVLVNEFRRRKAIVEYNADYPRFI